MNRFLSLVVAAIFALFSSYPAYARNICSTATTSSNSGNCYTATTNPPTADLWSNGGLLQGGVPKVFTEITQDYTGSLYPTSVLGTQTLGTSSFPWNNIYATSETVTGSMNSGAAGSTNATGLGGTAATQNTVVGLMVFGKVAVTGIVVSTTIPVNSSYETLMSTAGNAIIISATPSVSTTTVVQAAGASAGTLLASGTYLVLTSTGASGVTLQDEGTLTGSRLQLGAATRAISQFKVLTLVWDATDGFWREVSYANN